MIIDCPATVPTAVQAPGTAQETVNSSARTVPGGKGVACSRQRVPSHASANPPGGAKSLAAPTPTAVPPRGAAQGALWSWWPPCARAFGAAWGRGVGGGLEPPGGAVPGLRQVQRAGVPGEVEADRGAGACRGAAHPVKRDHLAARGRGHGHEAPACAVPYLRAVAADGD